jgi:hypothetical protein
MPSRFSQVLLGFVAIAAALAAAISGCAKKEAPPLSLQIGHHHVVLQVPRGWEHLDHGKQHLFRKGEAEVSLSDLGAASRVGIARELGEARQMWVSGRREDAFAKVRGLRSPELHFATSAVWTSFWRAWNSVSARGAAADSATVGAAFDSLFVAAGALPPVTPSVLARYAFQITSDMSRREIARSSQREIEGFTWIEATSWDQVTHGSPMRIAILDNHGYLLALTTDRGPIEQTGPAFDALLASIRVQLD